jgi:transposase
MRGGGDWVRGGTAALVSRGPAGGQRKLTDTQLVRLQTELDAEPAVHGWTDDQRWTLARVTQLIRTLFRVSYTPRGVSYVLHRLGRSPQVPVHRAAERDMVTVGGSPECARVVLLAFVPAESPPR